MDDCLARQQKARERLARWMSEETLEALFEPSIEQFRRHSDASASAVVEALFRFLLEENSPLDTYAYIALKDLDEERAAGRAQALLDYPNLSASQRERLQDVLASWRGDLWARDLTGPVGRLEDPAAAGLARLLNSGELEENEAGHLWVWVTHVMSPAVRMRILEEYFAKPQAPVMAITAVEVENGDSAALMALAPLLARRPEPEAADWLRVLAESPSLAVRAGAAKALDARALATGGAPVSASPAPAARAWLDPKPLSGFCHAILAVEMPPGRWLLICALIDFWDAGLLDVWVQGRLRLADVEALLPPLARQAGVAEMRPADPGETAGWMLEAEALARRRGEEIPPFWPVWRRILRAVPGARAPRGVVFGLLCRECRAPIHRPRPEEEPSISPLVLGSVALCQECLRAKTQCEACGARIDPLTARAVAHSNSLSVELLCENCYQHRSRSSS